MQTSLLRTYYQYINFVFALFPERLKIAENLAKTYGTIYRIWIASHPVVNILDPDDAEVCFTLLLSMYKLIMVLPLPCLSIKLKVLANVLRCMRPR